MCLHKWSCMLQIFEFCQRTCSFISPLATSKAGKGAMFVFTTEGRLLSVAVIHSGAWRPFGYNFIQNCCECNEEPDLLFLPHLCRQLSSSPLNTRRRRTSRLPQDLPFRNGKRGLFPITLPRLCCCFLSL